MTDTTKKRRSLRFKKADLQEAVGYDKLIIKSVSLKGVRYGYIDKDIQKAWLKEENVYTILFLDMNQPITKIASYLIELYAKRLYAYKREIIFNEHYEKYINLEIKLNNEKTRVYFDSKNVLYSLLEKIERSEKEVPFEKVDKINAKLEEYQYEIDVLNSKLKYKTDMIYGQYRDDYPFDKSFGW